MNGREVLEQRARELARPSTTPVDDTASRQVVRFRYDGAGYAVPVADVRQVVALAGAARLPAEAWPLVAVGAVAGEIVPVHGLRTRDAGAPTPAWGIAVESGGFTLCLPADAVDGIIELSDDELTRTGTTDDPGDARGGAITVRGDVLLDVDALVSPLTRDGAGAAAAPAADTPEDTR